MKRVFALLLVGMFISIFPSPGQEALYLGNGEFRAEFDARKGAFTSLSYSSTGWDVIPAGEGLSFDMTVRRPDGSLSAIRGMAQRSPECQVYADSLVFIWPDLQPDPASGGSGIAFTGVVRYDADKGLLFSGRVDNRSSCRVETLDWPIFGAVSIPDPERKFLFNCLSYTALKSVELYPEPGSAYSGGCNLPEQAYSTIGAGRQGVYISSLDPEMREYIRVNYELLPTPEYNELLGSLDAVAGHRAQRLLKYRLRATRHLFVGRGENYSMTDVAVLPYTGDWQAAADIYKKWRKTWFKVPYRPDWINDIHAWQQLQINSSESRVNFTIDDLLDYARDCKKYGIRALQITGWNWGGQDRGMPVHDVDPRLGTFEEFRQAIAACEAMGVKIILFTKFTWIEVTSPWYDLYRKYIVKDVNGDDCMAGGYRYNTYTQLTSFNNRRFGVLCFLDDDCRALIRKEFKKCLDLGASGMNYDENQHHSGTQLCYDPCHGHKVADDIYRGDGLLAEEFCDMIRTYNPDFIMFGEGSYDNQGQYYATYTRQMVDHIPLMRYIDPDLPIVSYFTDHLDKNRINMCLMDKYILCYEPRYFKGRLSEFPRMMEYGRQVDDLRRRYRDRLWNVVYKGTTGAEVSGDDILYSVLVGKSDGKRAVVILNKNTEIAREARVDLPGSPDRWVVVSPEHPDPRPFADQMVLQPQGAVVVMER